MDIINLNQAVFNALKFFNQNKPPRLDLKKFSLPLVAAAATLTIPA